MRRTECGFTLVEMVISIAVLSISLLFVAQAMKRSGESGNSALWQAKSVELANALMDEIYSKRYDESTPLDRPCRDPAVSNAALSAICGAALGPEEASRDLYDDSDDLHGFNTKTGGDTLTDLLGTDLEALRKYQGFAVSVAVTYNGGDFGRPTRDLKRITLYVFPPGQSGSLAFSSYRGNY